MDGGWSDWSRFSPCSKTCGGGLKTRIRDCNDPSPSGGGEECQGEYFQSGDCNKDPCKSHKSSVKITLKTQRSLGPVDGSWSDWSPWGACSVTCGGPGVQLSRRECSEPTPKNGGANCSGEMVRNQTCNSGPCVNGKILTLNTWL